MVNAKNELIGIIDFEDLKPIVFNSFRLKYTTIPEVMKPPLDVISYEDGMEVVMEKFENAHLEQLPVTKNGKYFGFISKVHVLETYRKKLKEMVIE